MEEAEVKEEGHRAGGDDGFGVVELSGEVVESGGGGGEDCGVGGRCGRAEEVEEEGEDGKGIDGELGFGEGGDGEEERR